jgi:hypothetical protein
MKRLLLICLVGLFSQSAWCWGFYGHRLINYHAVFLLPPEMMALYKPHQDFLAEHAADPDKRRYAVAAEAPRHYIDIDHYGAYPYPALPRKWSEAVAKFSEDSLQAHGIVPWYIQTMLARLTDAFRQKNLPLILKYSADLGHYVGDAHVPLHASSNHNGQHTNQHGIHGFWESRVPELLAEKEFDFFIGKATYLANPSDFIWQRVLESARAADTVLRVERELTKAFPDDQKFAFEERNGVVVRQYSAAFTRAYDQRLGGMVERRMRQSMLAVASCWLTAWVNAGQPDLRALAGQPLSAEDAAALEALNRDWKEGQSKGRVCD